MVAVGKRLGENGVIEKDAKKKKILSFYKRNWREDSWSREG